MSYLARLVSDNSRSLEKFELGALSSPTTLKEKILHGIWVLRVRFNLSRSINFRDINGSPELRPITLIMGHPRESRVVPLDSADMISY